MSLLDHIRSMLPSFKKSGVTESIELTIHAIRELSAPAAIAAGAYFNDQAIKSKEAKALVQQYDKRVDLKHGNNIAEDIGEVLENALAILEFIAKDAKKVFNDTEANISLTYQKATYLRIVEAAEFASDYTLKFLNWIYVLETAEFQDGGVIVRKALVPAEQKWLEDHFDDYLLALVVLKKKVSDIEKGVKELPDAQITELTEATFVTTVGEGKIDPFNMRQFSAAVNPFYLLGIIRAEAQARKYKAKQAEVDLLQLRLLNLRRLQEKNPDAKLQREIEYTADRVSGLNYDLERLQKEYLHD